MPIPITDNGGPAFPQHLHTDHEGMRTWPHEYGYGGMTLRVWLAAHAPKPTDEEITRESQTDLTLSGDPPFTKPLRSVTTIEADLRYRWADAMIARRDIYPDQRF